MKITGAEYTDWLKNLKNKIKHAQSISALAINKEMIFLYWEIGKELQEKLDKSGWGNSVIDTIEHDLNKEFPDLKGFSKRNLFYMKSFYNFYFKDSEKVQQLVAQIPWGHNILIYSKSKSVEEAIFYLSETIHNGWSRSILNIQVSSDLYIRQGKTLNNFKNTLNGDYSELVNQTLKDPYVFDFLTIRNKFDEKELESQLIDNISKFLLELGKGFAFIGKQYKIELEDKDYFLDLLFYHVKLRCYVVIELKIDDFKPEYAGKLNFYLSVVDDKIKSEFDNPTIGMILCKSKNKIEAEYALRGMSQPIGIADYELSKVIPENIKRELPSISEIEQEIKSLLEEK